MANDIEAIPWIGDVSQSRWYGALTAFSLGSIVVIFLTLLGGAIEQSTALVNISGELITAARMASIGLGTGYYFGLSLKRRESGVSWFLFGVFTTLTVMTKAASEVTIFGQFPSHTLLITGALLSIIAHLTPVVTNDKDNMMILKFLSGYVSTAIIVILSISGYIFTLFSNILRWFQGFTNNEQIGILLLVTIMLLFVIYLGTSSAKSTESEGR